MHADPTVDEPTEVIRVTGIRGASFGNTWVVACRGSECMSSANSIGDTIADMMKKQVIEYQEVEEAAIDLCRNLYNSAPSFCAQFRPSLYFPNPTFWTFPALTNGCGAGSIGEAIVTRLATGHNGFTGDLDEPLIGVSFASSCNAHDICYGSQSGQSLCDENFFRDLQTVCGSDDNCENFAYTYRAAVGQFGAGHYANAGEVKQCKEFQADFKDNCASSSEGSNGTSITIATQFGEERI